MNLWEDPAGGSLLAPPPRVRAGTSWELSLLPQWNDVKRFRLPRRDGGGGSESPVKSRSSFIGNKRAGDFPASSCEANQVNRRRDWLSCYDERTIRARFRGISDICQSIGTVYSRWYLKGLLHTYFPIFRYSSVSTSTRASIFHNYEEGNSSTLGFFPGSMRSLFYILGIKQNPRNLFYLIVIRFDNHLSVRSTVSSNVSQ